MLKFIKNAFAKVSAFGAAASGVFVATAMSSAHAAGTYDSITAAVDWSDVVTAVVAIGALIAAVLVVKRGVGMLLRTIGR